MKAVVIADFCVQMNTQMLHVNFPFVWIDRRPSQPTDEKQNEINSKNALTTEIGI